MSVSGRLQQEHIKMPVGTLNDRYWFLKNLRRHRERLGKMKAETDSSAPKLPVDPRNDKRKVQHLGVRKQIAERKLSLQVGVALQRVQRINNDNARLLVRLSKVTPLTDHEVVSVSDDSSEIGGVRVASYSRSGGAP